MDMTDRKPPCRGRFAPSPTGPLHFGSLVAAVGSFLDARARQGEWLIRMEDLDPPREIAGAADSILRALEAHGLHWDSEVLYQSTRHARYREILAQLEHDGWLYPCACSRSDIQRARPAGKPTGFYPGTCREGLAPGREPRSVRVRTMDTGIAFKDRLQGPQQERLPDTCGDYVLQRADGLFAYQLAVVVDDQDQGVTDVVRGADLLDSTGRQIYLQQLLAFNTPTYLHLPVAVNAAGEKLSKQTHAPPLQLNQPGPALCEALRFLGQAPPAGLNAEPVDTILQWATAHWHTATLPREQCIEHH